MKKYLFVSIAICALSGCFWKASDYAIDRTNQVCGRPIHPEGKATEEEIAHKKDVFACHQRVYPELLRTEQQRRAQIDRDLINRNIEAMEKANEINTPTRTNCQVFGNNINCTTY